MRFEITPEEQTRRRAEKRMLRLGRERAGQRGIPLHVALSELNRELPNMSAVAAGRAVLDDSETLESVEALDRQKNDEPSPPSSPAVDTNTAEFISKARELSERRGIPLYKAMSAIAEKLTVQGLPV